MRVVYGIMREKRIMYFTGATDSSNYILFRWTGQIENATIFTDLDLIIKSLPAAYALSIPFSNMKLLQIRSARDPEVPVQVYYDHYKTYRPLQSVINRAHAQANNVARALLPTIDRAYKTMKKHERTIYYSLAHQVPIAFLSEIEANEYYGLEVNAHELATMPLRLDNGRIR